jgi:hypothetical protein
MGGEGSALVVNVDVPPSPPKKLKCRKLPKRTKVKKKQSAVQLTIQQYAENPPAVLPKTDHQRIKELKELMIRSGGKDVAEKVIQIALNDDHPGQMAALKMCMDRTLPIGMFEKDKSQRSAITINITGLGETPKIIDTARDEDITDV